MPRIFQKLFRKIFRISKIEKLCKDNYKNSFLELKKSTLRFDKNFYKYFIIFYNVTAHYKNYFLFKPVKYYYFVSRSSHPEVFCKKVTLQILQNLQENTCASVSFFDKVAAIRPAILLKTILQHRCFPVDFARFVRIPFFREQFWWLFLYIPKIYNINKSIHQVNIIPTL